MDDRMLPRPPQDHRDFVTPPPTQRPHLTVSRGGLYEAREAEIEQEFYRNIREAAAGAKRSTNSKAYPGPLIAQLAVALMIPFAAKVFRLLVQNWKGGGGREFGDRIFHAGLTANAQLERKYGKPSPRTTHAEDKGAA